MDFENKCMLTFGIAIVAIVMFSWILYKPSYEKMEVDFESNPTEKAQVEIIPSQAVSDITGSSEDIMNGQIPPNYYYLDDGADGMLKIEDNMCSPSCCSDTWPVPFETKKDPYICAMKKKGELVPSQYFCNNSYQGAGCLCMNKDQAKHISGRK